MRRGDVERRVDKLRADASRHGRKRETRGYPRYFELTPVNDMVDASLPQSRHNRKKERKKESFATRRDLSFEIFLSFRAQASTRLSHTLKIPRVLIVSSSSSIYIYTGEEVLDIGTACGARLVMQMLRIDVGGTDVREGCRGTTSFSGLTEKERQ